jgi:hypothetical protein
MSKTKKKSNPSRWEVIEVVACSECGSSVGEPCLRKTDLASMAGIHRSRKDLFLGHEPYAVDAFSEPALDFKRGNSIRLDDKLYTIFTIKSVTVDGRLTMIIDAKEKDNV